MMATNGDVEEDVQTDEMIRSERPIMRNPSLRRRLRGMIDSISPNVALLAYNVTVSGVIVVCMAVFEKTWSATQNKKALLSQRRPRDAPNIWVP